MSGPAPRRDHNGRIHVVERQEDGIVVYRADSGWWNLGALPNIGAEDLLAQIERAWNEPGSNPGYHARMKRLVREQMPILAAYLDLLSAPQYKIGSPAPTQARPGQSSSPSEVKRDVLAIALDFACPFCLAPPGTMCNITDYPRARIHIKRIIAAGLGNPQTP